MNRVRLKKFIDLRELPFVPPTITRDVLGRVEKVEAQYVSIKVTYNSSWIGESNNLDTYNQVIEDC